MNSPSAPVSAEAAYELLLAGTAPPGLRIEGAIDFSPKSERSLPSAFPTGLCADLLNLSGCKIDSLPEGLQVYELNLSETLIRRLPANLRVESRPRSVALRST